MSSRADRVVIGMDPHKRSATIEVMSADEAVHGGGRFGTDRDGYAAMLRDGKQWPHRVWAIEGCAGIGKHIANRLLADCEDVVDVPPKLAARARVFATGQGRKTDATDAHSAALAGTRMAGLRPVVADDQLAVLRILVDRRRSLSEDHTRMLSQHQQLLVELIPGGAKKDLTARQAKALLAKVRPRDDAGKARQRVAAELVADLERIYQHKKSATLNSPTSSPPPAPACSTCPASARPERPGYWSRSQTSPASRTGRTSRPGTAPHPSTPPPPTRSATASPARGTGRSTACCTSWPASRSATPARAATTTNARRPQR